MLWVSLRRTVSLLSPDTPSTLCLEVCPERMRTCRWATPRMSATKAMSAAFAAPRTGGALSLILNAAPCVPTISLLGARGTTYTAMVTLSPELPIAPFMGRSLEDQGDEDTAQ